MLNSSLNQRCLSRKGASLTSFPYWHVLTDPLYICWFDDKYGLQNMILERIYIKGDQHQALSSPLYALLQHPTRVCSSSMFLNYAASTSKQFVLYHFLLWLCYCIIFIILSYYLICGRSLCFFCQVFVISWSPLNFCLVVKMQPQSVSWRDLRWVCTLSPHGWVHFDCDISQDRKLA